jgi:(1->4)-alpha-D-glucan 1-alpha-D-glucosylmutase
VGAWPIERERLSAYLEKALREAKVNTDWDEPNERWERSVLEFATGLYDHKPFRDSFDPFVERVTAAGEAASLGALLLKLASPGMADIYQGDELWDLNLVDPDNRRPVAWDERREILDEIESGGLPDRRNRKLYLIREALALRARRPDPFLGAYTPVSAPPDVCAFTRGDEVAAIVGLRGGTDLDGMVLPGSGWRDLLPRTNAFATVRLLERA